MALYACGRPGLLGNRLHRGQNRRGVVVHVGVADVHAFYDGVSQGHGSYWMSRHSGSDATVGDRGRPDMECAMASHKFHVGESVNLRPVVSRNVPGGAYEVTSSSVTMGESSSIASRVLAKNMSASPEKAS